MADSFVAGKWFDVEIAGERVFLPLNLIHSFVDLGAEAECRVLSADEGFIGFPLGLTMDELKIELETDTAMGKQDAERFLN